MIHSGIAYYSTHSELWTIDINTHVFGMTCNTNFADWLKLVRLAGFALVRIQSGVILYFMEVDSL